LCPLLPALQKLTGTPGILGAALSGAGPSVLVFLDPKTRASKVKSQVAAHLRASGLVAELIVTGIDPTGRVLKKS
jgi:homoserine kinase